MDSNDHTDKDLKKLTTFLPEILDLVNLLTSTSDITATTKSVGSRCIFLFLSIGKHFA